MAGAFTHILLCETALYDRDDLSRGLRHQLRRNGEFARLGSVSPDLPYLAAGGKSWADAFHYDDTDSVAHAGLRKLAADAGRPKAVHEAILAWLMGYASHLVADATIHPVVEAIVGPYEVEANRGPHRLCEMAQDVLAFREIKHQELNNSEVADILRTVGDSPSKGAVFDFWHERIRECYPGKTSLAHPSVWFGFYKNAIDIADGGGRLAALFRHLGADGDYVYEPAHVLEGDAAGYRDYFANVKLPDGNRGPFMEHGFRRAQDNIVRAWNDLYQRLEIGGDTTGILCNWNLDTGVDQGSAGKEVTFWA